MVNFLTKLFGSRNDRLLKHSRKTVARINAMEPELEKLDDQALRAKTQEFKDRLAKGEALDDLLTAIKNKQNDLQAMHHKYVPIAVKIAPDLSEEELIQVADSLVRHNIDGVIATNTTLDRSLVQGMKNCDQTGGLSGRPLQLKSTEIIRRLSLELNGRLPIIGVGGIDSVIAAREKIAAGASLVQIYSGFIFKGPPLIKEIVTHI